jgi:hypothetical protein
MRETARLQQYYRAMADGRFTISTSALESLYVSHGDRILDVYLRGYPAKILLLDKPLKLGYALPDAGVRESYLHRVSLNELPGWPPKLASTVHAKEAPSLLECSLRKASYLSGGGPGQGGLLISLEHRGRKFQAWQVDCPSELLLCAEATLNQEGIPGRTLRDIQDIRLIGAD